MTERSGRHPGTAPQALVADIGGTRARFALVDGAGQLSPPVEFELASFADPLAAIRAYLSGQGNPRLGDAVLAIAAPVGDGQVVSLTNASWIFDRVALKAALGLRELQLINDFTALALALPVLGEAELRQLGGGSGDPGAPKALLGPGTGLGVSGLIPAAGKWTPLAGEGGHVTLAAADEREAAILALARREYAHVSAERLVSGSGLPLLHRLVNAVDGRAANPLAAPEIVAGALAGDASCRATIDVFCAFLGSVAGNLALTLGARGGLYLGGGVVPRLRELVDASPFRHRFEAKGRFKDFLKDVPAYVILATSPALRGAAQMLPRP